MKINLLFTILFFSLFSTGLIAQITLTSDYLPVAGDKIELSVADDFSKVTLPSSGNHDADFSKLVEVESSEETFIAASESAVADSFPSANLVLNDGNPGFLFYYSDATTYDYVGFVGEEYLGIDVPVRMEPLQPVTRRKAPFEFGDNFDASFDVQLTFSADVLPDSLLGNIQIKPDSIRVTITSSSTYIAEGFGKVTIPGATYDALRIKSIEDRDTKLEGKLGQIWINITSLVPNPQLGERKIETYTYYSNESSTPILSVEVDNDRNITGISYKKNDLTPTFNPSENFAKADLSITPNPVIDSSTLNFSNVQKGTYQVRVFNVLGREVWSNFYELAGNNKIEVDFGGLRKGTYLYSLIDDTGKTITTKRLLVLRP